MHDDWTKIGEVNLRDIQGSGLLVRADLPVHFARDPQGTVRAQMSLTFDAGGAPAAYTLTEHHQDGLAALDRLFSRLAGDISFYDAIPDERLTDYGRAVKAAFFHGFEPATGAEVPSPRARTLQRRLDQQAQQGLLGSLGTALEAQREVAQVQADLEAARRKAQAELEAAQAQAHAVVEEL